MVNVQPLAGGDLLLEDGDGSGSVATFECGEFDPENLPIVGQQYTIAAIPEGAIDQLEWFAVCTVAGLMSEFTGT